MKLSNEARVGLLVTVSFTVFIIMIGVLAKINISRSGYSIAYIFRFFKRSEERGAG